MGMVWKVCEPDDLLDEARRHAEIFAARSIPSLIAVKQSIVEPIRADIAAATERENAHFADFWVVRQMRRRWRISPPSGVTDRYEPVGCNCAAASMIARTERRHRPQSRPAPHLAATSLDVRCPAGDHFGNGLAGDSFAQAHVHQRTPDIWASDDRAVRM